MIALEPGIELALTDSLICRDVLVLSDSVFLMATTNGYIQFLG